MKTLEGLNYTALSNYFRNEQILTFTTIPLGMCLSTTQLLVLLVACPPGPDPLTNCSSRSSSFKTGRSINPFLLAAKRHGSPDGCGLSSRRTLEEPVNAPRLVTLYMIGRRCDIAILKISNKINPTMLWILICCGCHDTEEKQISKRGDAVFEFPVFHDPIFSSCFVGFLTSGILFISQSATADFSSWPE